MEISREIALELLSLEDPFSKDDLKERYRSLSKLLHPDVRGDNTLFLLIKNCYNYLLNNNSESITKQKGNEKKQYSKPQNYYVSLNSLYQTPSYLKKIHEEKNITDIKVDINVIIKPVLFSKHESLSIELTSYFKDFLSKDFVMFEKNLILPKHFKKYFLFNVEVIFLGKVYKKRLFLDNKKDCARLLIKYEKYCSFNSFIELKISKQ